LIPPSAQTGAGGGAAAILGQLGGLGGLLGAAGGGATKHMSYLNSDLLRDQIIKKFDLQKRWGHQYLSQTRDSLARGLVVKDDKKSGLITLEFTDADPKFAADLLNAYVESLSQVLGEAAIVEARERREFLEKQIVEATRKTYQSPQVRDSMIQGLIQQAEASRFAERQPAPTITQVDIAMPPEFRSAPQRAKTATSTSLVTGVVLLLLLFLRHMVVSTAKTAESTEKLNRIRRALRLKTGR
jgi:uncharacterized protein involved in exopolysaccharide biosynthesis